MRCALHWSQRPHVRVLLRRRESRRRLVWNGIAAAGSVREAGAGMSTPLGEEIDRLRVENAALRLNLRRALQYLWIAVGGLVIFCVAFFWLNWIMWRAA